MELHIPHRVYSKVSEKDVLRGSMKGRRRNTAKTVRDERRDFDRRHDAAGSCAHVCIYTAKDKCIRIHGIPEGEECLDGI